MTTILSGNIAIAVPTPPDVRIVVLHGANLNLLGTREPGVYGAVTLDAVNERIKAHADALGVTVVQTLQTNHEGVLIDAIHAARDSADALVLNPGAWTHYSHAVADAVRAVSPPLIVIETHLSNIHAREPFRHTSVVAAACSGQICGFGADSYMLAVSAAVNLIRKEKP